MTNEIGIGRSVIGASVSEPPSSDANGDFLLYIYIYVIVIARGQGFMAVNKLSPRAKPEDKVCLRCHKSLATRAITVI